MSDKSSHDTRYTLDVRCAFNRLGGETQDTIRAIIDLGERNDLTIGDSRCIVKTKDPVALLRTQHRFDVPTVLRRELASIARAMIQSIAARQDPALLQIEVCAEVAGVRGAHTLIHQTWARDAVAA